jgi:hypothetical protein
MGQSKCMIERQASLQTGRYTYRQGQTVKGRKRGRLIDKKERERMRERERKRKRKRKRERERERKRKREREREYKQSKRQIERETYRRRNIHTDL